MANMLRNVAQLILSILLLLSGKTEVLKTSIVGSLASNLLLMFGLGILAGTYKRSYVNFNQVIGSTFGSILLFTIGFTSILKFFKASQEASVLTISRVSSVIILTVYL